MVKKLLLSALVVGMGSAWLHHFYQILTLGKVSYHEPNAVILWAEIVGIAAATLFGAWCTIRFLRRRK